MLVVTATTPSPHPTQDMTRLPFLHEPGVLHNLSARYRDGLIYTYTGAAHECRAQGRCLVCASSAPHAAIHWLT